MLARSTLALRSQAPVLGAARNMATLREIELRLKSVRNIEKITKASRSCSVLGRQLIPRSVHENDCIHQTE